MYYFDELFRSIAAVFNAVKFILYYWLLPEKGSFCNREKHTSYDKRLFPPPTVPRSYLRFLKK
jgi:hypothetical protein